jgi:hypothetical protein
LLIITALAAAFLLLIGYALRTAAGGLAVHGPQIQETYLALEAWLEELGVLLWPGLTEQHRPGACPRSPRGAAAWEADEAKAICKERAAIAKLADAQMRGRGLLRLLVRGAE